MPKILEDMKETILQEAKRQVLENGYSAMTIRSVAKNCKIAVGTIYNYYPSKEVLTASFMLGDWMKTTRNMKSKCETAISDMEVFKGIYSELLKFYEQYTSLFEDAGAEKSAGGVFKTRHIQLRSQIAELIMNSCCQKEVEKKVFLAEFTAESLLAWAGEKRPFEDLAQVLVHLWD